MNDVEICLSIISMVFVLIFYSVGKYYCAKKKYESSEYFNLTHIPYGQLNRDLGFYGEYLIYLSLKSLENQGVKFLFNLYIPTSNGKTTEIDTVMIAPQGIFVFESKNYSGWIFGSENQTNWTQSLSVGYGITQKEKFYNPIMQNEYHIKYISKLLNNDVQIHSVVVFSDHCELKNINRKKGSKTYLVYRKNLLQMVQNVQASSSSILSMDDIDDIFNKLYPYSQVDEFVKIQHIANLSR